MKTLRKILGTLLVLIALGAKGQNSSSYFYYYKGEKVPLELNTSYAYVAYPEDRTLSASAVRKAFGPSIEITKAEEDMTANTLKQLNNQRSLSKRTQWQEVALSTKKTERQYLDALTSLKHLGAYVAPYFKAPEGDKIGLSQYFYVKLKKEGDLNILKETAIQYGIAITGQNKFMPQWFVLDCMGSSLNALEAANLFYESGDFAHSEPALMYDNIFQSTEKDTDSEKSSSGGNFDLMLTPNDPYFRNQWGLKNNGYNGGPAFRGIDIKAESAWEITRGNPDIIVAVTDDGFDVNHPDLAGNVVSMGYDAVSATTPAVLRGRHGTPCAGIVGASQNTIGMSGVAPLTGLMPISFNNSHQLVTQIQADGINWAWQNGAAVISNSWGHDSLMSSVIDDAISNALQNGRGGLGTVMVFSTGNDNLGVRYPANKNPDVLAVGAMSPCGERVSPSSCDGEGWGSNYGNSLDVVAPGIFVPSTDLLGNQGYNPSSGSPNFSDVDYTNFWGTSAACPHVAGVAALVLAVNPTLTAKQVNDIIEESAQKVRTDLYRYERTTGRLNGTWNNEMGYGLLDAHAAVLLATPPKEDPGLPLPCPSDTNVDQDVPSGATDTKQASNSISAFNEIFTRGSADYSAGKKVKLGPGFKAHKGSSFRAFIEKCRSSRRSSEVVNNITDGLSVEQAHTIEEVPLEDNTLKIFPNPTQGQISLSYTFMAKKRYVAVVHDINGRPLLQQEVSAENNALDLKGLTPGIYLLRFSDGTEEVIYTRKIVLR